MSGETFAWTCGVGLVALLFLYGWAQDAINELEQRIGELEAKMKPGDQIPACYGFVGDGWHTLLEDLHTHIAVIDPHYRATDVKEKFGRLQLDFVCDPEHFESICKLVRAAEDKSCSICEICGEAGEPRWPSSKPKGWIKTVCDKHHELRSLAE